MRSGRGRSTLEASLDLKRSCDLAALWNLDRGSGRTRRHTEHRIRPGDPCWNVHVYRGESCRQTRALGRSHCERCILICKDLLDISFNLAKSPPLLSAQANLPSVVPRPIASPVDAHFIKIDFRSNIRRAHTARSCPRSPLLQTRPDARVGCCDYE